MGFLLLLLLVFLLVSTTNKINQFYSYEYVCVKNKCLSVRVFYVRTNVLVFKRFSSSYSSTLFFACILSILFVFPLFTFDLKVTFCVLNKMFVVFYKKILHRIVVNYKREICITICMQVTTKASCCQKDIITLKHRK